MTFLTRHGLDIRFLLFVMLTMALSVMVGGLVSGFFSAFETGHIGDLLGIPFLLMIGGGFAIPIALILWIVPSAIVFGLVFSGLNSRTTEKTAAIVAGTVTTLVATLALRFALTGIDGDLDGVGAFMFVIGPVAILLSPVLAGRIYGSGSAEATAP